MAVGEGGLEGEEQEGPNLNHESAPSLETNLERKWNVRAVVHKRLRSNRMSSNNSSSYHDLLYMVKSERQEVINSHKYVISPF